MFSMLRLTGCEYQTYSNRSSQ